MRLQVNSSAATPARDSRAVFGCDGTAILDAHPDEMVHHGPTARGRVRA
jgi:hypothetical protein